jgi:hypothetical protein
MHHGDGGVAFDCDDEADVAKNARGGRRATVSILPSPGKCGDNGGRHMFVPLESRSSKLERRLVGRIYPTGLRNQ